MTAGLRQAHAGTYEGRSGSADHVKLHVPPLVSVVVPTRDRATYALATIRGLLRIPSQEMEVVVQDNSSDDRLEKALCELASDPRLRYRHLYKELNVNENFDAAMTLVTGRYVTFLGDDDGMSPEVLHAAHWAEQNAMDAISTSDPATYYWPDFRHKYYGSRFSGDVTIRDFSGRCVVTDPHREVMACACHAGLDFAHLPKVYYGLVRRSVLKEVFSIAGTHFPGVCPDMAGAVAVGSVARRACFVDYPLFICGNSGGSMAGLGARKRHIGRLEDFPHLPRRYVESWSEVVPRYFSGPTIWAEAALQAMEAMGQVQAIAAFNLPRLYAACLVFNPGSVAAVIPAIRSARGLHLVGTVSGPARTIWHSLGLNGKRLGALSSGLAWLAGVNSGQRIRGISDSDEAMSRVQEYLIRRGENILGRLGPLGSATGL